MSSEWDLTSSPGPGACAAAVSHHCYKPQGPFAFAFIPASSWALVRLCLAPERVEVSRCGEVLFPSPGAPLAAVALSALLGWIPAPTGGSVGDSSPPAPTRLIS